MMRPGVAARLIYALKWAVINSLLVGLLMLLLGMEGSGATYIAAPGVGFLMAYLQYPAVMRQRERLRAAQEEERSRQP